ncbi:MAG TPA: hypothetical protein VMT24_05525, partial [Aggregatilineaceae bacterium]|nr:hypothetical protein [Aggregatilineaceae bacterium]
EGVTMYLDAEAVDETLALIHASAAKASLLAFDAIYGSVLRRENRYAGEKEVFERVARAGEGWTFGVDEGAMPGFLAERGFEIVAFYTASDLEKAYLTAEDGSLHGHVNGTHCLVVAKTV